MYKTNFLVSDSTAVALVDVGWLFDNRTWRADASAAWNVYTSLSILDKVKLLQTINKST